MSVVISSSWNIDYAIQLHDARMRSVGEVHTYYRGGGWRLVKMASTIAGLGEKVQG